MGKNLPMPLANCVAFAKPTTCNTLNTENKASTPVNFLLSAPLISASAASNNVTGMFSTALPWMRVAISSGSYSLPSGCLIFLLVGPLPIVDSPSKVFVSMRVLTTLKERRELRPISGAAKVPVTGRSLVSGERPAVLVVILGGLGMVI